MTEKTKKRRLYLMCHGKTTHAQNMLNDFSKSLTQTGLNETLNIYHQIQHLKLPLPDCVLCSSATRTIQTLELLTPLFPQADIFYKDALYLAPKERLEELINTISNHYHTLFIIAHNNGLENLLNCLINNPRKIYHLPPAGCALLTLKPEIYWRNLCQGTAFLNQILQPQKA